MHYFIHRDGPSNIEKNTQTWTNMSPAEKDEIYKEYVEVNQFFTNLVHLFYRFNFLCSAFLL